MNCQSKELGIEEQCTAKTACTTQNSQELPYFKNEPEFIRSVLDDLTVHEGSFHQTFDFSQTLARLSKLSNCIESLKLAYQRNFTQDLVPVVFTDYEFQMLDNYMCRAWNCLVDLGYQYFGSFMSGLINILHKEYNSSQIYGFSCRPYSNALFPTEQYLLSWVYPEKGRYPDSIPYHVYVIIELCQSIARLSVSQRDLFESIGGLLSIFTNKVLNHDYLQECFLVAYFGYKLGSSLTYDKQCKLATKIAELEFLPEALSVGIMNHNPKAIKELNEFLYSCVERLQKLPEIDVAEDVFNKCRFYFLAFLLTNAVGVYYHYNLKVAVEEFKEVLSEYCRQDKDEILSYLSSYFTEEVDYEGKFIGLTHKISEINPVLEDLKE